ncbi:RadC family protein, partial [Neisseria sp.]|uniref:JAB domain-containing protein n=1 Tax=Neisseria sp. TaxID=192066 RepID=UPI0026DBC8D4
RLHLGHERVEVSVALLLNNRNQLIALHELSRGTVAENTVYVREIVKLSLEHYAAAVIIAHNHPGGSPEPSQADIAFTRRLAQALELVDVVLLDHFIVTARQAVSLHERGLMGRETAEKEQVAVL